MVTLGRFFTSRNQLASYYHLALLMSESIWENKAAQHSTADCGPGLGSPLGSGEHAKIHFKVFWLLTEIKLLVLQF